MPGSERRSERYKLEIGRKSHLVTIADMSLWLARECGLGSRLRRYEEIRLKNVKALSWGRNAQILTAQLRF